MQTFFNPTTPFLDAEGHPLVGARVSFLDTETSGDLLDITDHSEVPLPNPLFTGADGRLRLENGNGAPAVPCVADGVSYKVTVARRTGVEPVYIGEILQNASELFEEPDMVFVVTAMGGAGSVPNTTVLDSIAGVRLANKELGSVVCTGYYSAGDCPSRTFTWVNSQNPPADNAINVLRNPEDASGYWKMGDPAGGLWDIRVAGCSTSKTAAENDQCLTGLLNIVNGYAGNSSIATAYFPEGNWLLDSGFVCGSICLEKGANLKPADNTADRTVVVDHLENRGGLFYAYGNAAADKRVVVVTKSVLRSSWFKGTLNEFLTQSAIASPEEIVFDAIDRLGSANVTISKKVVHLYDGVAVGNNIKWSDCLVLEYSDGELTATSFKVSQVGAGVTLDIDGLRMGDSNSSVEVNHAGMIAKNSDESYTMQVDFSAIVFHNGRYTGTLESQKLSITIAEQGGSTLTGSDLTISNYLDYTKLDAHGIESSTAISIEKGAYLPWAVKHIDSNSPDIDNALFGADEKIEVVASLDGSGLEPVLSASPTLGREIKLIASCTDITGGGVLSYHMHLIDSNNDTVVLLAAGGSVYLVADGANWNIDYTRI